RALPTPAFFYGLKPNEEIMVTIGKGKSILIKYLNMTEPDELGNRLVFFSLNGQTRSVQLRDINLNVQVIAHQKASAANEVGAPLQGNLSKIFVKEGDVVEVNAPLFVIEAMKMESTITAPMAGKVKKIHLKEKTLVDQMDLVVEME
ncbi:MAG: biotin/lipoyl-containing protein, partial [Saprospiraceae bacterium]